MKRYCLRIAFALLLTLTTGSVQSAEVCNSSKEPELGVFAPFATALQSAKDAHSRRSYDQERTALLTAKNALEKIAMEPQHALIRQDFQNLLIKDTFSRIHGSSSEQLRGLYLGLECGVAGGLYEHLYEAICSHESRMPYYSKRSDGLSDPIFRKIAFLQRLNLPIAWYIDLQARRFQKAGVPIIIGDLVSMSTLPPKEKAPRSNSSMKPEPISSVRTKVKDFQKKVFSFLKRNEFSQVASATHELALYLRKIEQKHNAHLAMLVHMVDSLGYTALHAADYQKQTQGKTDNLARQFLTIQTFPLQECLPTDQKAQSLHTRGIGVIVNDVPDIPFLKEWDKYQKRQH